MICIGKFNNLHWKQSKFLLVLHHEALSMASGQVDFSSSEISKLNPHNFIYMNPLSRNLGSAPDLEEGSGRVYDFGSKGQ